MAHRYTVRLDDNNCLEVTNSTSSILVYRIPYERIKDRTHALEIRNRFIVYILHGKNLNGKDYLYVGKSKNGIDNRPVSHEDKYRDWDDCYILTTFKERTFLNDGTIQYIEDAIKQRIDSLDRFIDTTNVTNVGTANSAEEEDCDEYLEDVYDRLFLMGLDLYPRNNPDDIEEQLPQGHLTGDENKGLFGVKPKFLNLYNSLVDEIMKINSDITATAMKVYIKFMLGKRYLLSIDCNNSAIIVYFCAKPRQLEDPKNVLKDVSSVGHHGRGDLRFDLNDAKQIPVVCEFVNQVINL
ncbi:hypothetical protein [Methanomethylophilus alvi]|uniref:hypothetical protein n=1 Tax=Methanomethylophilus alvi TaxID=1291540 RepID=UPI0037DC2389